MVVFKEKDLYFFDTMMAMNVMRKDVALCDILLTFGQRTIHAHRCVLAAASPYFNSLFLGNFNEASMGNIDLSSVTTDTEAVEMIIDFIYTGEINITEDNVGVVIKLASFFLVECVREFCLEFMNKSLNLKNCLSHFFCSQDYGHHELYQKALPLVESRFHDYIIFEEASLDISPEELHFLLTHKVLQFCRVLDLLEFVLKWLLKGPTQKHFAVALDVIDNVIRDKNVTSWNQRETDLEDLYERVAARQEVLGTDIGKTFLTNSRRIMSKISHCSIPGPMKTYNLRRHSSQLSSNQEGRTEMALVAFAPRPCVVQALESKGEEDPLSTMACTESVFDLCVYLVSNQTWYHVQQLKNDGIPSGLLCDSYGMRNCTTIRDTSKVIFIWQEDDEMWFLDLRHMTWREVAYYHLADDLGINETISYFEVTSAQGANHAVYLILKIRIWADEERLDLRSIYLRCYRLQDDNEWEFVFKTPTYDTEDWHGLTVAMISSGSNEMLILHSSDSYNCVYLADMSEEKPQPVPLLMTSGTNECLFDNAHLLEVNNQIYVVKDTPEKIFVTHEYKLKSRKLIPVGPATPTHLTESGISTLEIPNRFPVTVREGYPCLNTNSVSDGKSLWQVKGSKQKTSHLTELRVSKNKSLLEIQHTPPPFPFVTTLFAGQLDKDVISRLEPIVRYLSP